MTFLLTLGLILLTWLVLAAALAGTGLAFQRQFGIRRITADGVLVAFWLGFCGAILLLQIWHLVFAVSWQPGAILAVAGLYGWGSNRKGVRDWLASVDWRLAWPVPVVLALAAVWTANRAMGPQSAYDSGVYHIQAMRWVQSYPIVPGLGNLHGRLAFNSASSLYAAMLAIGPWHDRVEHVANGALLLALLIQILIAAFRLRDRSLASVSTSFDFLLLTPVVAMIVNSVYVSSLNYDTSVTVLLFVAASRLHRLLTETATSDREAGYAFASVATLLTTAVCLKLSAAPFAVCGWGLALVVWWRSHRGEASRRFTLGWALGLTFALGLVLAARGVLLSGYVAYPSTIGAAAVDWRLPLDEAEAERAWTSYSARWFYNMGLRYPGWEWLPGWVSNSVKMPMERLQVVIPGLLAACALGVRLFGRGRTLAPHGGALLLIPTLFGIGVWFLTAPDPRFACALFWTGAATVTAPLLARWRPVPPRRLMAMTAVAFAIGGLPVIQQETPLLILPGSDHGLHPMPRSAVATLTTHSGLAIYAPVTGDRCWDAPLPCTPHAAVNLRLRVPGRMESGFAIDGPWQPSNWPDRLFTDFLPYWRATHPDRPVINH